jgi:hypothetical protein
MSIYLMPELIEFIGEIILSVQDSKEPVKSFFVIFTLFITLILISALGQNLMTALLNTKQFQP